MKKKWISVVMMTTLAVSLLAGCGTDQDAAGGAEPTTQQEAQETTTDGGVVTLKVWAEESTFDMYHQMIDAFKQEYAGQAQFDITLEQNSDSDTKNNVLGDIHNAADVFPFPDDQLSGLVAAGALYPVPNASDISSANTEASVEAATIGDTLYAYPMTADNGYFLYYNKKYLSDSDVATLDGILSVAEKNGKKFSMEFSSGWYLYSFFGNTDLDFGVNEDGVTNHCDWNSTEGAIKGVDIAEALLDVTASKAFLNEGDSDFVSKAGDDSVIAGISGVWNDTALKNAWGDNLGAAKLPTYTVGGKQVQMASFTGFKMMGVNAYSAHPEWAAKLADWLTNEQNQTMRFTQMGQGPSNTAAAASDEVGKSVSIQAVLEQSQYGKLQRVGNSYWDACTNFANSILAGDVPANKRQELMDTLVSGITASVAQ